LCETVAVADLEADVVDGGSELNVSLESASMASLARFWSNQKKDR
jgi:hypothetical protein